MSIPGLPAAWLAILLATLPAAAALQPGEQLPDAAQEKRARALSSELRCLVCQNQSIDDSDAPLARDLRRLVRERILAGDDDQAIRAFLVARYGEFVLLKPTLSTGTILLWGLPFAGVLLGGWAALSLFRRTEASAAAPAPLLPEEESRLEKLLERRESRSRPR
jgi:cytochrome c-type biogenesis protein CcmH